MSIPLPSEYADRVESDLLQNILPAWQQFAPAKTGDDFYAQVDRKGEPVPDAEKSVVLISRLLWTFSKAYHLYRDSSFLKVAERAYRVLERQFFDVENGGYYWAVLPNGEISQTQKKSYGQAFVLYGLAAYHQATGLMEAKEKAFQVFRLLEENAKDSVYGGYFEVFSREWQPLHDMRLSEVDLIAPKSQNALLHVMEAFTELLTVAPDKRLHQSLHELVTIMLDRVLAPTGDALQLFFAEDWKPLSGTISFGHDIEAAWLLLEGARAVGDPSLLRRVEEAAIRLADAVLLRGCAPDGAIYYEGERDGTITVSDKSAWVQAEGMLGFLAVYMITGDNRYLQPVFRLWDFIEEHLIDRQFGDWYQRTDLNNEPVLDDPKIGFWKCPYHSGRAGMYLPRRLREVAHSALS